LAHHPFLVNLHGFSQNPSYLYFAIEYVPGGDLFTYLRKIGKFDNEQSQTYAAQITLMFEYLHSLSIIYRDLKPENLLIAADGYLKLTDFGFAKRVEERTYTLCGTPEYIAPEVLLNKGHGKAVDWWTLGVIIYEMLAGIDPFNDEDPMLIYQKILKCKFSFPRGFDSQAKSLIKHLLVVDLSKRYGNLKKGVEDIKKHKWFKHTDWLALVSKTIKMPYVPYLQSPGDTSNFMEYPDSYTTAPPLAPAADPFLTWNN
jgi:serine/threonine protein kinase